MPTNHVISIRDQRISVCDARVVAGGKDFDTFTIDADCEWEDLSLVVAFGTGESQVLVSYGGAPAEIPRQCIADPGWLAVAVVGYGEGGEVKATTEAAPHAINVVLDGQVPDNPYPDSPDLLGQLVDAAEKADASADAADKAATSANDAAKAATEAAGKVNDAVESATKATKAASDAATAADSAAKRANDAADTAEKLAEDIPGYVTAAEQAATKAASAASAADGSATAAGKSARAAAGSAEKAAGSATAAQGSADAASGSAKQAATSAEEAAGSATAAGESAEDAQGHATDAAQSAAEAESWADAAQVSAGNVLTGTASGNVAHADDAYAAKPREVRIEGRTVKNLWPAINGLSNGVTVSTDETGLITVSGTATADATITAEAAYAPSSAYVMASTYGSPSTWHIVNGETQVTSGTQLAAPSATCGVVVKSGTAINASFRVMLVEGTEAPDCFTPTGVHGVEPEKLMVAGKNLLAASQNVSDIDGWSNTVVSDAGDGWIKFGFNSGPKGIEFSEVDQTLLPGKYVLSFDAYASKSVALNYNYWILPNNSTNISFGSGFGAKYPTLSTSQKRYDMQITVPVGIDTYGHLMLGSYLAEDGVDIFIRNVQLELGSTATAYEPPDVNEVALPETDPLMDGDVMTIAQDGAVSVDRSDGTTDQLGTVQTPQLPAPTFNVYPTGGYVPGETGVDYERDVNIAYAELETKVSALTVAQATS